MSAGRAFEIDAAAAADLAALSAVAEECGLTVDFQAELAKSFAVMRVARDSSGVLGFLLAWRAADELHLTDLGVHTSQRRRGVGKALLQNLRAEGLASSARVVLLEVRESNAGALALYASLGFTEIDRRERYYADTDEDAVVMQLELR